MNSLIDDRAIEEEEDDDDFDEEDGEARLRTNGNKRRGDFEDSSEEEDDDDEEAAAEVAKGFIADEDEVDDDIREERKRERRKRRREEREREEEDLDDEDLEVIGVKQTEETDEGPKYKRLKRGPREDRNGHAPAGLDDMFRDEEEEEDRYDRRVDRRGGQDEFDDFIEEDVFSDDEQQRRREDEEVARPTRRGMVPDLGMADAAGLDEQALEDFRAAFGDGTDYDFALEKEDEAEEDEAKRDKELDLKDVFEPSQLAEKMLTDEDNQIRITDEPERHQLARKPYRHIILSEDEVREEANWISGLMLPKRKLTSDLHDPFKRAVAQVLDFLVREDYEVPFIFQNRKDYLIHAADRVVGRNADGTVETEKDAKKLLHQNDLWEIFDSDLKFRALMEKRHALQATYDSLKEASVASDAVFESMLPKAVTMEELQDMQDYLYFQYASQLKDLALTSNGEANGVSMSRKKAATSTIYEEIRNGKAYSVVRAFGITADAFARNAAKQAPRTFAEDPTESPEDLADTLIDKEFPTGVQVLKAAKSMFVEELVTNPRLRGVVRENLYVSGVIDCYRTEKGMRKIDELHPYYEFKYLRNQEFPSIARHPEMYLRMLKAEEEGLIEVKVRLQNFDSLKKQLYKHIETDNYSNVADSWNQTRREVVTAALEKVITIMGRAVKENLRTACEGDIMADIREEFTRQLDQAPYTPKGMKKGTIPRVLALSNGDGVVGRDTIYWAYVAEDGRVLENGKFVELAPGDREKGYPDGKDVDAFLDLVKRREPDVIGISGYSPETKKLHAHISTLVEEKDLRGGVYQDQDDDRDVSDRLEVVIVHDEIARLYQSSDRAKLDHPSFAPLTHYCVALAKYMQDPLKEYAALSKDVTSLSFSPAQHLLPEDKVLKTLETVLVDFVNMVGIDLNEAVSDTALAALLPYVAGLGPRKASHLLKVINLNGGVVNTREELLGVNQAYAAVGVKVWNNCAGTLFLEYDKSEPESEYLDNTRIHPEDYDIARKMAADALELDEEDIKVETDEYGRGAIVRKLIDEDAQDRVNDLVLEEYAEQLERNLNQRKRATLENIRAEFIEPYEELRQPFMTTLSSDEIFTMFTGETKYSLEKGMNVPLQIKKISDLSVEGKLDCGVEAFVLQNEVTDRYEVSAKQLFAVHQTVQAHIVSLDRKNLTATVSLRGEYTNRAYKKFRPEDRNYEEWDGRLESADKKILEEKNEAGGRAARVIKHPLFRAFNSAQAEEFLGSQNRGDVVIRPSSKGTDHLAVTWKVSDGLFQHIDVLELDKENEFSLGKTLRIGGKYTYSDLDELIALHVKPMARKVDEMTGHEKFLDKTKTGTGESCRLVFPTWWLTSTDEWLTTYTNANTKRAMYMFCFNRERPGYFHLCFKAGQGAKLIDWQVKVIPYAAPSKSIDQLVLTTINRQGYELMKQPYPNMRDLQYVPPFNRSSTLCFMLQASCLDNANRSCRNGFKLLYANMNNSAMAMRGRR